MNVRYVLEGSVQRGGNRMRVNVQLIDAETSNHLWAERFDKPLADLFDMQDEIVARLAGALNAELVAAEARRAEQASNPDSMDLYFQGMACLNKGLTPDNVAQARGYFDRALAADPDNIDSLIGSALADVYAGVASFVTDPMAALRGGRSEIDQGLVVGPGPCAGHMSLGFVDIFTRRAEEGIAECEHALTLDRNLANAHSIIGIGKIFIGRAEETEAHIGEALRVSPRDTMAYNWMAFAGLAKLHLGSWEQGSRGFAGQSRPTEIIRYHISSWPPRWLNSVDLTRRVRSQGRSRAQPSLHNLPRPRRLDGDHRQPHLSGPTRAHFRRHAQGRSPGRVTAARRLAAILAADVGGYSWLMGQDEAGTAKAATPSVGSFGGQLVQDDGLWRDARISSVSPPTNCRPFASTRWHPEGLKLDGDRLAAAPAATRSHASRGRLRPSAA